MNKSFSSEQVMFVVSGFRDAFKRRFDAAYPDVGLQTSHVGEAMAASFWFKTLRSMQAAVGYEPNASDSVYDGKWPERSLTIDMIDGPTLFTERLLALRPDLKERFPQIADDSVTGSIPDLYIQTTCMFAHASQVMKGFDPETKTFDKSIEWLAISYCEQIDFFGLGEGEYLRILKHVYNAAETLISDEDGSFILDETLNTNSDVRRAEDERHQFLRTLDQALHRDQDAESSRRFTLALQRFLVMDTGVGESAASLIAERTLRSRKLYEEGKISDMDFYKQQRFPEYPTILDPSCTAEEFKRRRELYSRAYRAIVHKQSSLRLFG